MEVKLDVKTRKLIIIIAVLTLTIGVTLAYVIDQLMEGATGNASVISDTVDNLEFDIDKEITLNPNQYNVTEGGGGLSDTAIGTATLIANSTDDLATYNYYVYFRINYNDYIYTTVDEKPEIVLTITNPAGNEITEVNGLEYVQVTNADGSTVNGFDITTQNAIYSIANAYEITADSTNATIQEWTFTVTFINLDTNQYENGGKTLEGEIILKKNPYSLADVCSNGNNLATCIQTLYNTYGEGFGGLYLHDGQGNYLNESLEAGDNSYRYSGANPNNYVCFGSTASLCPRNNLYRIIGMFGNEVKLIKSTRYGAYAWDSGRDATWDAGTKPDIYTTLNDRYYNNLENTWGSKIATHSYNVGEIEWDMQVQYTTKNYYDSEVEISQTGYKEIMKIGLMYVSDYGYAASPSYWATSLGSYSSATSNNWMYLGYEWTISPEHPGRNGYAFYINSTGNIYLAGRVRLVSSEQTIRPVFYLNSDVTYVSGDGTYESPYRIN